jgi:hypothetical protein
MFLDRSPNVNVGARQADSNLTGDGSADVGLLGMEAQVEALVLGGGVHP